MNDDIDLDSVLFGGCDPPADGSFDPFLPGLGQEGSEDYDGSGYDDPPTGDNDGDNVIRYGGFGGEGPSGFEPDDEGPLPWERTRDQPVLGSEERRAREAADTGDRYVRRVATTHSGVVGPGAPGREHNRTVASSIDAAQQRVREQSRVPLDIGERSAAVIALDNGTKDQKITRHYERQSITTPPKFEQTAFEATLVGLKANVSGEWIITLKVSRDAKQSVYSLDDAYGLALDINVVRRRFSPSDDS